MRNKRGWIRILEATIAVLIVTSVLVIVYSGHKEVDTGFGDYLFNIQNKILKDISGDNYYRSLVLNGSSASVGELNDFAGESIYLPFNYSLIVCDLGEPCKMDAGLLVYTLNKEVYSEEEIIASNITNYAPKKVKIFIWEER